MGYQAQCFYNKKILKDEVWKITNAITSVLNLVVIACVMNKSRGHWLLFDVLTYIVPTVNMEAKFEQDSNGIKVLDEYGVELFL